MGKSGKSCQVFLCPSGKGQLGWGREGMSGVMAWFVSGCWMGARAFQGGALDAFQCRIFPVRSAGVRQPRPVPSCLACLWGQEQEGSACREKGTAFCWCELYSWDFTLPFSLQMMESWGKKIWYSLRGFSVPHECFCFGSCGLALRENIVLFLHRKAWDFPARPNERPLIPLLKKNKGGFSFSWRASWLWERSTVGGWELCGGFCNTAECFDSQLLASNN